MRVTDNAPLIKYLWKVKPFEFSTAPFLFKIKIRRIPSGNTPDTNGSD